MDRKDAVYEEVRELLVETLGVEPDEVMPSANFFYDLGGESIDVLDLAFRCHKKYGVEIRLQEIAAPVPNGGQVTADSLKELQERFPVIDFSQFDHGNTKPLYSLFTVETIVGCVKHALAQSHAPDHAGREEV